MLTIRYVVAFLLVAVGVSTANAQYIARLEPHPYVGTLTACAGEQITVRGNHIENLSNPSTISARISSASGNMANGTDIAIDEYSFDGTTWQPGPLIWTSNISGPVYYRLTLPATLPAGNGYNLKLQSSNPQYIQSDQDFNAVLNITASYTTVPDVVQTAFGENQWIVHAYTWTATTSDPFFTQQLIDEQDFFNPSNYLGHFLLDDLSFDLDFFVNGGKMPGNLHDGTSIPCYDQKATDYSLRFQRTENFGTGKYRIELQGDDGIRLSIDGGATWLLDSFLEQPYDQSYTNTDLQYPGGICLSGEVNLVVEFFQRPAEHRATATFTNLTPEVNTPQDVEICGSETVQFDASSTSGQLGWQWQVSTDGGTNFNNLIEAAPYSGTTTSTLTVTNANAAMNGYLYQAIVTGICDAGVPTAAAELIVDDGATITAQDNVVTVCEGNNALIGVTVEGGTSFQWQADFGNGFENLTDGSQFSNTNSQTMLVIGADVQLDGVAFQCVIEPSCGPDIISDPVELLVETDPQFVVHPADLEACEGEAVALNAEVDAPNGTYQWQRSTDNGTTWETIADVGGFAGYNTAQLQMPALQAAQANTQYRCVVQGCNGEVPSDAALLTLGGQEEPPVIPNVFTPNGDNMNDLLTVEVEHYDFYHVAIYNRWGQLVGEFDSPGMGWDGHYFDGTPVDPGYYMMVVDISGGCTTILEGKSLQVLR